MSQILLGKNRSNPEVGILLVESHDVRFCTKRTFRSQRSLSAFGVKRCFLSKLPSLEQMHSLRGSNVSGFSFIEPEIVGK
jgi:hypothetical protein